MKVRDLLKKYLIVLIVFEFIIPLTIFPLFHYPGDDFVPWFSLIAATSCTIIIVRVFTLSKAKISDGVNWTVHGWFFIPAVLLSTILLMDNSGNYFYYFELLVASYFYKLPYWAGWFLLITILAILRLRKMKVERST